MDRTDVVVVGAGALGSAAARSLGERGVDTVLLEQFRVGHVRGSSHGVGRIFRLSYEQPEYVRMALDALDGWRGLEERAGEPLLITTGGIDVGPDAGECERAMKECGVAAEWISSDEVARRFPGVSVKGRDPVLFQGQFGVCLADRTVAAQVNLARQAGVDVREESPVLALGPGPQGVVVRTRTGEIGARTAVLTAGGWNRWILADAAEAFVAAGAALPLAVIPEMVPTLQQVSYFAPNDASDPWPTFIERGPEMAWYSVPPSGGAAGVKVGRHVPGRRVDPSDGPFEADPAEEQACAEFAARHLPGVDPAPVRTETCLYTMTADEDFVIDRVGPLTIAGGCSGHAFKFTPLLGEALADLATGRPADLPMHRFSAARPSVAAPFAV